MNRLGCLLGILLVLLSIGVLAVMVVLPVIGSFRDDPNVLAIQSALNCPSGHTFEPVDPQAEILVGEDLALATGYCISPAGQRSPITSEHQIGLILITVVLFLVPLLSGLALGVMGFMSGKASALASQPELTIPVRHDDVVYTHPKPATSPAVPPTPGPSVAAPPPAPMPSPPEPLSDPTPAAAMPPAPPAPDLTPAAPMPDAPMPTGPTAHSVQAAEKPPTQPLSRVDRLKQLLADYEQGLINDEQFDRLYKSLNDDLD